MKRIRLDIGALTASAREGGSFMFFLYREGMEKCLPVPLSAVDMHAILMNFREQPEEHISIQQVFASVLREYRIELLEVTVIRENDQKPFLVRLLCFDGIKEFSETVNFADGIVLARIFTCPIYVSSELMDRYATDMNGYTEQVLQRETRLQRLKERLQQAVSREEYELAEELSREINELSALKIDSDKRSKSLTDE